jgi:hypothetical protein
MSADSPAVHGHVLLVVTPNEGARPSYRAYIVAVDDPVKAQQMIAPHLTPGETAHVLAAIPEAILQIEGLGSGGALRL